MEEKNTNATKRRNPVTWVPSVYFAMGLPFVVLNMVTVLMFKGLDISDAQIALWTSVIMLPWTLKPLWSPFLEMYRTKKFFVVLTQLLSGCLFGLVALALNLPSFFALSIALLGIIALSGATHDVATDGVYMKELSPEDQAKYIGWQGAFYNLAKIVATGGLVYLAGYMMQYFTGIGLEKEAVIYAWMIVMLLCGTIMILLGFYHMKMLPSGGKAATGEHSLKESMAELWLVFKEFFTKKYIVWYICFIILYRFAEGFVIKIVPLFLESSGSRSRIRTNGARDRFVLWYVWSGGVRAGFFARWILYLGQGVAKGIVYALLLLQYTVFGIHVLGVFPA